MADTDTVVVGGPDLDVEFEGVDMSATPQTAETPEQPPIDQATEPSAPRTQPQRVVDLTSFPEFRKYQAEQDRKYQELRKQMDERERISQAQQAETAQARANQLLSKIDEFDTVEERQRAIEEIAAARFQAYSQQQRQWDAYVQSKANDEGLDPSRYLGKQYATREQFEAELNADALKALRKQLEEAKNGTAPEALQKQVVKLAHEAGYTAVDAKTPAAVPDADAFARDLAALQVGRMPPDKFAEKWKDRA